MSTLPATEIAERFRQAIAGCVTVKLIGPRTWDDIYCGNVDFLFGDWKVTFYNDCYELDYTDRVLTEDGREYKFDDEDPLQLLTTEQQALLENLVERTEATR